MDKLSSIIVKTADITKEEVCAIVNAANSSLLGGGGVDGAIHKAGGSEILQACQRLRSSDYPNGLETGEVVSTTAGNLRARHIIHTVGPIYTHCHNSCKELLSNCYNNALQLALKLKCNSIAFPAISTGVYGYPKEEAAIIAFESAKAFLDEGHKMEIRFIFHSMPDTELFQEINHLNNRVRD